MSNYPSYPTTPPKKCEYCNGAGIIDPYGDEEDVAQADPRYPHETCWRCKGTGIQTEWSFNPYMPSFHPPSFHPPSFHPPSYHAPPPSKMELGEPTINFDPEWQEMNKSSSVAFSLAWNLLKSE